MVEEAPAFVEVLGPLIQLCGLIAALAFIVVAGWVVSQLLNSLAGLFSFLPFVGGITASTIHAVESALSRGFAHAISGIEQRIGHQWHNFARVLQMAWAEQKLVAENLWHLAQSFYHAVSLSDLRHLLHRLEAHFTHVVARGAGAVAHDLARFQKTVRATEHRFAHRITALEAAIAHTIPREIGSLWGATKALEDSLGRLWDRVRDIPTSAEIGAAIAAAVAALGLVGLDLIKCSSAKNAYKNWGCNLWSRLENLLPLAFFLTLAFDFPEFVHAATIVADGIGEAVASIEGSLDLTLDPLPPPNTA